MKIKIFCIYHKSAPIWKSDCIEPIQSGAFKHPAISPEILRDNTGDNISHKNDNYGEMSVWYWVWKNYIPEHPELEYIGFCHYRRFFSFSHIKKHIIPLSKFSKLFPIFYHQANIQRYLDADIILPPLITTKNKSILEAFHEVHGKKDIDIFTEIVKRKYPQHASTVDETLNGNESYFFLNYIIRVDLYISFMQWLFPILQELEEQTNWEDYKSYDTMRMPAYIVERYFPVWVNIIKKQSNITIKHLPLHLIQKDTPILKKIAKLFLFLLPRQKRRKIKDEWNQLLAL